MGIPREKLLWLYETMATIRSFEDTFMALLVQGKSVGVGHSSAGQEAVPSGICAHLTDQDYLGSTHRGHGHCIAKGVDPRTMMAELFGKATGTCHGRGGSFHIADFSKGMIGANGIVVSSVPVATGAALSAKLRKTDQVAVAFFGDGGLNQGALYESMNLASIWKLPVLFVCENNRYAESTPFEYATAVADPTLRAQGFNMPGLTCDGQDVFSVYETAEKAVARARAGEGPSFIVADTYRYGGHFIGDNTLRYRSKEEEEHYKSQDCLKRFRERVVKEKLLAPGDITDIDARVQDRMDKAVKFAEESPFPQPSDLLANVYVNYP